MFNVSFSSSKIDNAVRKVYLTIVDELSMAGQQIIGLAETVTRKIRGNNRPWGGIHICFTGDWLQLPPIGSRRMFEEPNDKFKDANTIAAFELWTACNFRVILQNNMRQRTDPPFAASLRRLHWGVATDDDIEFWNEAADFEKHILTDQPVKIPSEDNFSPIAIGLNIERCAFNRQSIKAECRARMAILFEVAAEPSNAANTKLIRRLDFMDEDKTDKVPLLFQFYIGMPIMITKRIKKLEPLRLISNGTIGNVLGFIPHGALEYRQDDCYFDIAQKNGIIYKRFKNVPKFMIVKIRGCNRVLVEGYPIGVCLIPPLHAPIEIILPHNGTSIYPTVDQFPFICANAMTPEKLQGITLFLNMYFGEIIRKGVSEASCYVAFSRVLEAKYLVFIEHITRELINKFNPPISVLMEMKNILENLNHPPYMTSEQSITYFSWLKQENEYCREACQLHVRECITQVDVVMNK